eukprot:1981576-Amphidinium_carterae.1
MSSVIVPFSIALSLFAGHLPGALWEAQKRRRHVGAAAAHVLEDDVVRRFDRDRIWGQVLAVRER